MAGPSTPPTFAQLLPMARQIAAESLLEEVDFRALAGEARPRTLVNFVASIDGRATFQGRSGQLGDDGDHALFHALREQVDAVMAGTGTLAVERYGRILASQERRERRTSRGLAPEPLACLITRSGQIPWDIPLFACPEARIVVFAPRRLPGAASAAAQVEVRQLAADELTTGRALEALRREYGVRSLLCEGGPRLFASMLRERVVDDLFLTIAPTLTGGGGAPGMTEGPELPELATARIAWLLERRGSLFLRYVLG